MTQCFDSKDFLRNLTHQPGVYRMYDSKQTVIYVGKARDLKKRLSSYFRSNTGSRKTEVLVAQIAQIDVTITHSETEALLLEHNYIKLYQPRYNVLLRDDKSYPYIFLSADTHPRLTIHRGAKQAKGEYFGPFPNGYAVRQTLILLQKIFPVRQCENSVYRNRSRPCLQYQIGRCLGPCVKGLVSDEAYQQQTDYVRLFLSGKDTQVLHQLVSRMEQASQALQFEEAARLRDQIQAVRQVTEKQFVSTQGDDLDAISIAYDNGMACVHVLFIRQGKVLGSRSYFPKVPANTDIAEVVQTFVGQFYLQGSEVRSLPSQILLDFDLAEFNLLGEILTQIAGRKVNLQQSPRGPRAQFLKLARTNAANALKTKLLQQSTIHQRLKALADFLAIPTINRMECFDISHTMGEQTIASCVVFDANGPLRSDYRRFNIEGITPGDDYAAMNQVLMRRYNKPLEAEKIPDVIIIDGGKGQLAQAKAVFEQLEVNKDKPTPILLGVAKGSDRKAGLETLFLQPEGEGIALAPDSPALHVIQYIRDESHNHAIRGHRKKRAKVKSTSSLENIEGVGPVRRQQLLKYMGGLQPLRNANDRRNIEGAGNITITRGKNILFSKRLVPLLIIRSQGAIQPHKPGKAYPDMHLNIPTYLTLFRVMLIPFFVIAFYLPFSWSPLCCAIVFVIAAVTDWLDGFLARLWKQTTAFGAFLDPVADKVMVAIALVLVSEQYHNWWVTLPAATMIAREIIISALREWMAGIGLRSRVAVSWIGKVKTTAQMLALVALLWRPSPLLEGAGICALYIAAVLTFWSMFQYLSAARQDLLDP